MGIAAVAGIGVGDDERTKVGGRRRAALLLGHARAQILLIAIGGEQGAHQDRGLVGHLAERIARQIGPGVLARRAPGRGRPAAEVDALDPQPLDHHRLAGRVRAERRDALLLSEQLAQAVVERRRRLPRHGVVVRDRAALLDDLARRVQAQSCRRTAGSRTTSGSRRLPARMESCRRSWSCRVPESRSGRRVYDTSLRNPGSRSSACRPAGMRRGSSRSVGSPSRGRGC